MDHCCVKKICLTGSPYQWPLPLELFQHELLMDLPLPPSSLLLNTDLYGRERWKHRCTRMEKEDKGMSRICNQLQKYKQYLYLNSIKFKLTTTCDSIKGACLFCVLIQLFIFLPFYSLNCWNQYQWVCGLFTDCLPHNILALKPVCRFFTAQAVNINCKQLV